MALALHDFGKRKGGPFVPVNMAAIPRELIESELFGHEKGAFTGANARRVGRFEQAEGGTLFLDEIGDMPIEAQTRLLRVLQQGEFVAVGGHHPIRTNVRIVAASHRDLRLMVGQGLFREDLFYRLNVVPLRLPPLRERVDDIPALAQHFLVKAQADGLPLKTLTPEAMVRLKSHAWPGNVRELENLVRRLAVLYAEDTVGEVRDHARAGAGARTDAGHGCRPRRRQPGRRHRAAHRPLFPRPRRHVAAAGHLRPADSRARAAADRAGTGRDPRQPAQGGRRAGPQPQHAQEEDP